MARLRADGAGISMHCAGNLPDIDLTQQVIERDGVCCDIPCAKVKWLRFVLVDLSSICPSPDAEHLVFSEETNSRVDVMLVGGFR